MCYDILKRFQGIKVTAKGKEQMNPTRNDERYNELLAGRKAEMKKLVAKIVPNVYEYGSLRKYAVVAIAHWISPGLVESC